MTTNNRFFLGTLNVTIGEYSNLTRSLIVANPEARAFAVLDRAAASMYGDGKQAEDENGYEWLRNLHGSGRRRGSTRTRRL